MPVIDLIHNLALLIALSVVSGFIENRWKKDTRMGAILQGVVFGGAAVIGILNPLVLGPGLIFDGRSIMVSICGLFFGFWSAALAGLMAAICRILISGIGTLTGVLVVLSSVTIGLLFHEKWRRQLDAISVFQFLLFGLVVHVAMLAIMFTLPLDVALTILKSIGLPIIIGYPLATVLIGKILSDQEKKGRYIEALKQGEEKYRDLVENLNDGIFSISSKGNIIYVSPAMERILGYRPEDIINRYFKELIYPDDLPLIESAYQDVLRGNVYPSEYRLIRKSGEICWVRTSSRAIKRDGQVIGVTGVLTDITDRKRNEEELRESEEKFRYVFDHSIIGKSITFPSGEIDTNQAFCEMLGYSKTEILNLKWQDITHPDDIEYSQRVVDSLLSGEKDSARFVKRYVHKNGSIVWADLSTVVRWDKEGKPLYMMTAINDITERKNAEEALCQSEYRLKELFENMSTCAAVYDAVDNGEDFIFKDFNKSAEKVENIDRKNLIGKSVLQVFPAVRDIGLFNVFQRVWRTGRPEHCPVTLYKDNRIEGWRENYVYRLPTGEVVAIYNDITESKRAEEELRNTLRQLKETKDMLVQSEKLAAIGRLSAGVGHEILNPVNIISMRIQMLEMMEVLPDKVRDGFAQMKNQIKRVVKITKDLSQFSRIAKRNVVERNLNQLVEQTLYLVAPRLKYEQVTLHTEFQPDLPDIAMEPDRIEQVIMNIINNAADALEGRENKDVRVRTELIGKEGREYLRLVISDNGWGIPPGDVNTLFDPFFTTKDAGKGTGLGLYICYNIIQDHGGRIWAENNDEGGASFFIDLPVTVNELEGE